MTRLRLTERQKDALRALAASPSTWFTPRELGDLIDLSSFSTAQTVASLTKRGWVSRDRTPGWPVQYSITAAGAAVAEELSL